MNEFSDELLSAYLDDELSAGDRARVEAALETDVELRRTCDELRALSTALQGLPPTEPGSDWAHVVLERARAESTQLTPASATGTGASSKAQRRSISMAVYGVAGAIVGLAAILFVMVNNPFGPSADVVMNQHADEDDQSMGAPVPATAQPDPTTENEDVAYDLANGSVADRMALTESDEDVLHNDAPMADAYPAPAANAVEVPPPSAIASEPQVPAPADSPSQESFGGGGAVRHQRFSIQAMESRGAQPPSVSRDPTIVRLVVDPRSKLSRNLERLSEKVSKAKIAAAQGNDAAESEVAKKNQPARRYKAFVLAAVTQDDLNQADDVFILEADHDVIQRQLSGLRNQPGVSSYETLNRNARVPQTFARKGADADTADGVEGKETTPSGNASVADGAPLPEAVVSEENKEKDEEGAEQSRNSSKSELIRVDRDELLAQLGRHGEVDAVADKPGAGARSAVSRGRSQVIIIVRYKDVAADSKTPPVASEAPTKEKAP